MYNSPQPATDDQIWKNFVFNEAMTSKVQHSCRLRHRYREDLETRLSCFGCENKNSRTFCGTFYSFNDDLLSKNSKKTTRWTKSAIWSIFADLNSPLSSKQQLSR